MLIRLKAITNKYSVYIQSYLISFAVNMVGKNCTCSEAMIIVL